MTNILEAIVNIAQNPIYAIKSHYSGRNRVNNIGEALETFVKDDFVNTIQTEDELEKMRKYNEAIRRFVDIFFCMFESKKFPKQKFHSGNFKYCFD